MKNIWEFSGKKVRRMDHEQKNDKTEKSNDSPEIPDRRVTSDIPGLPSEGEKEEADKQAIIN